MFTAIFLTVFLVAWLVCGLVPWLVASVATRGEAGLGLLPLCLGGAVVAGLAVPLLGRDDGLGILLSVAAALGASALLAGARLFARGGVDRPGGVPGRGEG